MRWLKNKRISFIKRRLASLRTEDKNLVELINGSKEISYFYIDKALSVKKMIAELEFDLKELEGGDA